MMMIIIITFLIFIRHLREIITHYLYHHKSYRSTKINQSQTCFLIIISRQVMELDPAVLWSLFHSQLLLSFHLHCHLIDFLLLEYLQNKMTVKYCNFIQTNLSFLELPHPEVLHHVDQQQGVLHSATQLLRHLVRGGVLGNHLVREMFISDV